MAKKTKKRKTKRSPKPKQSEPEKTDEYRVFEHEGRFGIEGAYEPDFTREVAQAIADMMNKPNPPGDWEETRERVEAMGLWRENPKPTPTPDPLAGSWLDPDARKSVADRMRELAGDIEKGEVTRPEAIHRLGRVKLKLATLVDPNLFPTANPPPATEPGDAQTT